MSSYQRVIRAIQHEPGNPVARGELGIDRQFAGEYLNWRMGDGEVESRSDTDLLISCCRHLRLDLVCIPAGETARNNRLLSPPASDIGRVADQELFVFWLVDGVFQSAMAERGAMALMEAMAGSPDAAARELRQDTGRVLAAISRGVGAGAHGIIIADDIAYRQGTYMSPNFCERYLFPLWCSQVASAHDLGAPVFFHSDGNLNAVLPQIVEAGFDGLQCIEPAAGMDIEAIKVRYGSALCLMGNIDPALLCEPGDPSDGADGFDGLRRAVSDVMTAAGGGGGFIFGTCSGLYTGMRPERVHCMYQAAVEWDPGSRAVST